MSSHCVSHPGLLEEVDDRLWGESESNDSDWVDEASTDDSELFSGVWSLNYKTNTIMIHTVCLFMTISAFEFE